MPGRPRTTLKRLNDLRHRAETYGSELYELMPSQYYERPDLNDPMCIAWRRAGQAAVNSCLALDALREQLAQKVARAEQLKAIAETGPG